MTLEDSLRKIVREELQAALAQLRDRSTDEPVEWLDTKGTAELLGVCERQVRKLARSRAFPSSRVGKLLRVRRSDLVAYMEARR